MTREEAIKKLERKLSNMKIVDSAFADCVDGEALEMAVKALKEEPRKKGHWVKAERRGCVTYHDSYAECSNCHGEPLQFSRSFKYCPHCGARMDEGDEGEE